MGWPSEVYSPLERTGQARHHIKFTAVEAHHIKVGLVGNVAQIYKKAQFAASGVRPITVQRVVLWLRVGAGIKL
jgi:hypothetical protein